MSEQRILSQSIDALSLDYIQQAPLTELLTAADTARQEHCGDTLELCSIVNAKSGQCPEDCAFCAQSARYQTQAPVYPLLDAADMVDAAAAARQAGARRFGIVTSGNRLSAGEIDKICAGIDAIRRDVGIDVCCSLGTLSPDFLRQLWQAGARRYHHNVETSARFYPRIVSTHGYQERIAMIGAARQQGFEICSGGIIGLGETWQDRWEMALALRELAVDAVPLNILVPIAGTPLAAVRPLAAAEVVRTICLFRLLLPRTIIKIAAGRELCFGDFQAMGFLAGANGMLIGGYLTVRGRSVEQDQRLVADVRQMWKK